MRSEVPKWMGRGASSSSPVRDTELGDVQAVYSSGNVTKNITMI